MMATVALYVMGGLLVWLVTFAVVLVALVGLLGRIGGAP